MAVWIMNAGDSYDEALKFASEGGIEVPVLLDSDETVYNSYDKTALGTAYAPFPLQVVIDRDGTIRYLTTTYEPDRVRETIDGLLAE